MNFNILFVLTGLLTVIAYPVTADDFAGGDGSKDNPWQISEPEHLDNIRNHLGDHFELIDDIDLSGTSYSEGSGWQPIGACDYNVADHCTKDGFTGLLDGNTHTITGLFIDREIKDVGLFGAIEDSAVIVDLNLKDVDITTEENYAGALAAVVFESEVFAVTVTGKVKGASFTGGVVGSLYQGTLQQVHADVEVDGGGNTGGVVGSVNDGSETEAARIKGSSATGNVTGSMSTGGLVGHIFNDGEISDSHATGDVTGTSQQAGGLVGALTNGSLIERSYATGNVDVQINIAGGLVGWNMNSEIRDSYATGQAVTGDVLGGLVGTNDGPVTRSYAVGLVEATEDDPSDAGGLIGSNSGSVTASFWDTETSGADESDGGTGHPSDVLKDQKTFEDAGWEFGNGEDPVWMIKDGSDDYISYPYLYPYYFDNQQDPPPGLEIVPSDVPAKVVLAEPAHEEATDEDSITFIWHESENPPADAYGFELAGDDSFDEMVVDSVTADTTITLGDLEWDSNYYWRVRAENEVGWGEYSDIRSIEVMTAVSEPVAEVPDEFGLDQNYPNPFNPATQIRYAIPEQTHVRLTVYDALGRRIATLVDESQQPGTYEATFDASALSSGVYIYRLEAGSFAKTHQMMLVK